MNENTTDTNEIDNIDDLIGGQQGVKINKNKDAPPDPRLCPRCLTWWKENRNEGEL